MLKEEYNKTMKKRLIIVLCLVLAVVCIYGGVYYMKSQEFELNSIKDVETVMKQSYDDQPIEYIEVAKFTNSKVSLQAAWLIYEDGSHVLQVFKQKDNHKYEKAISHYEDDPNYYDLHFDEWNTTIVGVMNTHHDIVAVQVSWNDGQIQKYDMNKNLDYYMFCLDETNYSVDGVLFLNGRGETVNEYDYITGIGE